MIRLHMVCSLGSYVAFLIAFLSGWLFLIQERQLKRKTLGVLFHRLPSLDALDRINFAAIGVGFGLLTIGMIFGLARLGPARSDGWIWDPKVIMTIGLWMAYCLLWLFRLRATLRGRRVALLSMLGFSLLLFTFLGVSRVMPSWHSYL